MSDEKERQKIADLLGVPLEQVHKFDIPPSGHKGSATAQTPAKSCNRHDDCDEAERELLARNPGKKSADISLSFHCHAEDCEDCFGS